ncbi:MAG: GxxExxY protein [Melioribacteraceae bacterium]|nr:GxxExxY protein [Melioribacteraceae bacterium]
MKYLHKDKTERIIKCFYEVYNTLGYGFLEKVYENALYKELISNGFKCEKQKKIKVYYKGEEVGEYFADILVDDTIITRAKSIRSTLPRTRISINKLFKSNKHRTWIAI